MSMQFSYIEKNGTLVEKARLAYLLKGTSPVKDVVSELFTGQGEDGGWPAKWSHNISSLDATCFHLAQAEQLGLTTAAKPIQAALRFLVRRQSLDGSWDEETKIAQWTPSYLKAREN